MNAALQKERPKTSRMLTGLCLAMLLSSLGISIANVALPTLVTAFTISFQAVQWVVLAYLLSVSSLIVGMGRLGDLLGRKAVLLAGLAAFSLSSAACGWAPTYAWLILARAGQGMGAAAMMALSLALVSDVVPKEKTGRAMGLLGTMSAIGTALGPSVGGAVISEFGWRPIFLMLCPLGLLALVLIHDRQSKRPDRASKSSIRDFDFPGTLMLAATLIAYARAMTTGHSHFAGSNLMWLITASVCLLMFIHLEKRADVPLLKLNTFADRHLLVAFGLNLVVSMVMMTTLVVGPFFLTHALRLAPAEVGLVMSVGPAVVALAGLPAGQAVDQWGHRVMVGLGLTGIVLGSCLLVLWASEAGVSGYLVAMVMMTLGYATFLVANNTSVMRDLHASQRGVVAGALNLSRNLGLITGAATMGALFSFASGTADIASALMADVVRGFRTTFFIAAVVITAGLALHLSSLIAIPFFRKEHHEV